MHIQFCSHSLASVHFVEYELETYGFGVWIAFELRCMCARRMRASNADASYLLTMACALIYQNLAAFITNSYVLIRCVRGGFGALCFK